MNLGGFVEKIKNLWGMTYEELVIQIVGKIYLNSEYLDNPFPQIASQLKEEIELCKDLSSMALQENLAGGLIRTYKFGNISLKLFFLNKYLEFFSIESEGRNFPFTIIDRVLRPEEMSSFLEEIAPESPNADLRCLGKVEDKFYIYHVLLNDEL